MAPLGTDDSASLSSSCTFDDVACRARDEAAELRNEICQLRVRLEQVEEERNYNAAKANEIQELLGSFKKEHVHEELVKKSLQVAEMSMSLDSLRSEIKSLKDENQRLQNERVKEKVEMAKLSGVVRSLQYAATDSDDDSDDEEELVLTPEKALDLTLKNMKFHIEGLEEEHQDLAKKCKDQEQRISELEKECELKDVKVEMLEELFRTLNKHERFDKTPIEIPEKRKERPRLSKANSSPDLSKDDDQQIKRRPRRGAANRRSALNNRNGDKIIVRVGDLEGTYVGPVNSEGQPNGVGTIRFSNGDTYLGEMKMGKMHGKGTLYHSSKGSGVSRGMFEDNQFVGHKGSKA